MGPSRREFLQMMGTAAAADLVVDGASAASAQADAALAGPSRADDLCFMSGRELAGLIRTRKLSARDVMLAHLRQIERVNPRVNAIVAKLDDTRCLALADEADRRLAKGDDVGPLHGLPFAFKDTEAAVGFPFTRGSPIFKDDMPTEDTVLVERLRNAGVLPIGKTNVPEFGMGSHTYNKVYGTTLNPYDLTKSAGGSSGGAAAALAAGMLPLANGSDLGGSLRNPGNFNNVVGFRPTVGLVPNAPITLPFVGFAVKGPLARSVDDIAYLMSVMAGSDPRDPGSYPSDPTVFTRGLGRDFKGVRVAWCPDLGGLPLDRRVRAVLEAQRATFEQLGCVVENACPDLGGADEVFLTLRAWRSWNTLGPLLDTHRAEIKPEAITRDRDRCKAERCRRRPCDEPACRNHGASAAVSADLRVRDLRGEPGAPVRRHARLAEGDRGHADGALHRVDEIGVLDYGDVLSRDLGARGVHARRIAGRHPDRRPVPRRSRRVADRACVRAGDGLRTQAARTRVRLSARPRPLRAS